MLDLAGFRALYPEFKTAPDLLVQSRLDQAVTSIDPAVWGTRQNEGHGLTTAHLLAISPYGQAARLVSVKGQSTYSQRLNDILPQICGLTFRTI